MSRVFHPNFSAKWRRYLYIFPLNDGENREQSSDSEVEVENFCTNDGVGEQINGCNDNIENLLINDVGGVKTSQKTRNFTICRVNLLLQRLEGKLLSYKTFARDTKASRSM